MSEFGEQNDLLQGHGRRQMAQVPKTNKQTNKKKQIAKGFEQNILIKAAEEGEGRRVYDQLMHSSLIG